EFRFVYNFGGDDPLKWVESPLSVAMNFADPGGGKTNQLTTLPISPAASFTPAATSDLLIYRKAGGAGFFFDDTAPGNTAPLTFTDKKTDTTLALGKAPAFIRPVVAPNMPLSRAFTGGSAPHGDSHTMVFDSSGDLIEGDDGGIY